MEYILISVLILIIILICIFIIYQINFYNNRTENKFSNLVDQLNNSYFYGLSLDENNQNNIKNIDKQVKVLTQLNKEFNVKLAHLDNNTLTIEKSKMEIETDKLKVKNLEFSNNMKLVNKADASGNNWLSLYSQSNAQANLSIGKLNTSDDINLNGKTNTIKGILSTENDILTKGSLIFNGSNKWIIQNPINNTILNIIPSKNNILDNNNKITINNDGSIRSNKIKINDALCFTNTCLKETNGILNICNSELKNCKKINLS